MKVLPPPTDLSTYIHSFWFEEWDSPEVLATPGLLVPAAGTLQLAFGILNGQLFFKSIRGQHSGYNLIQGAGLHSIFGISVYPHAVADLLGISPGETANTFASLDMVYNRLQCVEVERLMEGTQVVEWVDAFVNYFRQRLSRYHFTDRRIAAAVAQIQICAGSESVTRLANRVCLSPKQFERRFLDSVGLKTKLYSRIVRFEKAVSLMATTKKLTAVACEAGYYDQSHLIKDFKFFAGISPRDFINK